MTGKCGMVFGGIYRFHRRAFRSFKLSGFLPLFLGQKNWLHTFDGKLNDGRTQKTTGTTEKKRRRQVRGWNCLVAGGVDLKWCSSFVFCFFWKRDLKRVDFEKLGGGLEKLFVFLPLSHWRWSNSMNRFFQRGWSNHVQEKLKPTVYKVPFQKTFFYLGYFGCDGWKLRVSSTDFFNHRG